MMNDERPPGTLRSFFLKDLEESGNLDMRLLERFKNSDIPTHRNRNEEMFNFTFNFELEPNPKDEKTNYNNFKMGKYLIDLDANENTAKTVRCCTHMQKFDSFN